MSDCIAVINAGSSSIKFALYETGAGAVRLRGQVQGLGVKPAMKITGDDTVIERSWAAEGFGHAEAMGEILKTVRELLGADRVAAVGHRVVHGGVDFDAPVLVDEAVLDRLERLVPLAPLHQPHNLAPIRAIAAAAPDLPQVACFDTAFHRQQDALAQAFALPRRYAAAGVRRYGFHGLSYEFVSGRLRELAPRLWEGRVVIAHLGNGASLGAVQGGRSVATTMGFTALDGLMMGTRSGALDPGVLIYLMDEEKMDARAIEDLLYRRSGLLGVSGISSDMRALRASPAPEAAEAIALFVYRIVREIGSMAAALGGLDGLVFTGGIGENEAGIRADVMSGCEWLGVIADPAPNEARAGRISALDSRVEAWVIPTDEERMIARHTTERLGLASDSRV